MSKLFNTLRDVLTPYANKINLHSEEIEEIQGDVSEVKADLNDNGISNSFNGDLFNGYWDANGVITKYSGDVCPLTKIPCAGNANVSVKGTLTITNPTLFISYYDSLGTTRIRRDQITGLEYNGTSPENTGFVTFTFEKSGLNKDNVEHVFVGIDNEFQKIDNKTRYILSFTDADLSNGFVIGQTGKIADQFNTWKCTDYIPIPMMQGGTANIRSTLYSNGGTAFYDENKNFISGVNGNNASDYGHQSHMLPQLRTYQIPKGTFYFRLSLFLYDSSITASRLTVDAYISSYGITQTIAGLKDNIYSMNETESMYVNAGANYGHHNGGYSNVDKRFSVLVTTDVHNDIVRLTRAVEYANTMPCFDCGVTLGDISSKNYSDNDGVWYTDIIKKSLHNWLTLVGNHDFGIGSTVANTGTTAQVYAKFIEPNLQYMGAITDSGKCYYYKDYPDYNIRVICLNPYDVNNNTISGDDYVVNRYTEYYSQDQVDWFVNTLSSTPSEYHVVIMVHNAPAPTTKDETIHFNNRILGLSPESTQSTLIVDIVNAWISGGTLSDTYACTNSNLSTVTVSADFTSRGNGILVCYLTGHMHIDFVGYITKYPGQKVISLSATNAGTYQNGGRVDLPRADNTKAEDCITAFSVDTANRQIYLTRIGSSMSKWFDKREPSVISY